MIPLLRSKRPYARVHNPPPYVEKQDGSDAAHVLPKDSTFARAIWTWLHTIWPLILHCVGALGITALLLLYVNNNHFNVTERRPAVTLVDGTATRLSRFAPLQTDITTILSAALVVLRWVVAAWAGPLCWRTMFFLMEKTGLRRRDLEWLIGYGFFPPSTHLRHIFIVFIATILASTLCAQSASPILTGSIAWAPSNVFLGGESNASINVSFASLQSNLWRYYGASSAQTKVVVTAAGLANQAWGKDIEKSVLKRVIPSAARLNINSTITNVTLPFFQVTALEWISDPQAYNLTTSILDSGLLDRPTDFDINPGMLAFLSNTWRGPDDDPQFPSPSTVSETRILVLNVGPIRRNGPEQPDWWCKMISHTFPKNTGFVFARARLSCLAFARVTYTAGASVCTHCRLSSPSTVQNDSEISLEPDPMTTEALWMMTNVTANLVLMNTSIPSPWDDVDSYVTEVLFRSYSAGWNAFQEVMSDNWGVRVSRVYPTLPSLQAQIELRRVYAWLALQLLVTLSGIFFLWLQSRSKYALIGDTTMVAFDLDATNAPKEGAPDQSIINSLLKIEPKDDGWKVVVGPPSLPEHP